MAAVSGNAMARDIEGGARAGLTACITRAVAVREPTPLMDRHLAPPAHDLQDGPRPRRLKGPTGPCPARQGPPPEGPANPRTGDGPREERAATPPLHRATANLCSLGPSTRERTRTPVTDALLLRLSPRARRALPRPA